MTEMGGKVGGGGGIRWIYTNHWVQLLVTAPQNFSLQNPDITDHKYSIPTLFTKE